MTDVKQQNLELIEVYQSLPALWDANCEDYSDRNKKDEQYNMLLECYNRHNPEGQLADLRKKIDTLRTNFKQELRKRASLERNETEIVIPPVEPTSTLKPKDTTSLQKCKKEPSDEQFYFESDPLEVTEDANSTHLAKIWVEKLSKLGPTQKIFAEKVINEVVLKGQLGLLSPNTSLTQTLKQEPLNKNQFSQVFNHILQNNDEFVDKLYDSYLNLKHINKPVK